MLMILSFLSLEDAIKSQSSHRANAEATKFEMNLLDVRFGFITITTFTHANVKSPSFVL